MRHRIVTILLVGLLALAGCSANDPLATEANNGGVTTVGGIVTEIAAAERGEPVTFESSHTTSGETISSADFLGRVVVVNFWYASCPPCRVEAPELARLANEYDELDVVFVGVNVYDHAAAAESFEKTFDIPYPSILDTDTGTVRLAFAGAMPPNAVPTTLVMDRQGRVAARMSGAITTGNVLGALIDTVVAEAAP